MPGRLDDDDQLCEHDNSLITEALSELGIGLAIADVDGVILAANSTLAEIFGLTLEEVVGRSIHARDYVGHATDLEEMARQLVAGTIDTARLRKYFRHSDGRRIRVEIYASIVRRQNEPYIVGMVRDISQLDAIGVDRREGSGRYAQHDLLTGLPDRTMFFGLLDNAIATPGTTVAVCHLGLDGFRAVNDALGPDVGDELLRVVADRLAVEAAREGHAVARTGADEFAVLVRSTDEDLDLEKLAQQTLAAVRQPVQLGRHRLTISACAGLVRLGDGGTTAAALMRAADTTLHRAKRAGRNRYAVFDPEQHERTVSRFELAANLPKALADGEFHVEYQPLVRLTDQELVGVEALVRWELPNGDRIGPDEFVPIAEESGLIVPLGRWVLGEACRQAAEWARQLPGRPLLMSVNIAAGQVEPGIVDEVATLLRVHGLEPGSLQLELTESDVLGPNAESLDTLMALAKLGVRIAIDDFGTGYSNLAYLRALPVHTLKLAGSFVAGRAAGGGDGIDVELSGLLIGIAHALGLTVVAESVETAGQLEQLRDLGCDTGQGWHFAPALAPGLIPPLAGGPLGPLGTPCPGAPS